MNTALTVIGASFEIVGLGLVFVELAVIRSHEFDIQTPWTRIVRRIRRLLGRPQLVEAKASLDAVGGMEVRAKIRPGDASPDATARERLERLEGYVERLDEDLDDLWQALGRHAENLVAEAARRDQQLRHEFEQRESDRRKKLRPSLMRQTIGALCVLIGLVLGTLGNVL